MKLKTEKQKQWNQSLVIWKDQQKGNLARLNKKKMREDKDYIRNEIKAITNDPMALKE